MITVSEKMFKMIVAIYTDNEPEVDNSVSECIIEDFWNPERTEVIASKVYQDDGDYVYRVRERLLPNQAKDSFVEKPSPLDGTGFWGRYKGNSVGRAINHIYHICGIHYAENAVFHGDGIITQGQITPFALVSWDRGYPHFVFVNKSFNKSQIHLMHQG